MVLNWSTLQEKNTSHFMVEHSTDGRQFRSIGTVEAKGNTDLTSEYSFVHRLSKRETVNYYRLKQVDQDGKYVYSLIRTVRVSNGNFKAVQVLQNPVKNTLKLDVQAEDVRVVIHDMNGNVMRSVQLKPGIHDIDLQQMAAGMYHLSVYTNNTRTDAQRFVKVN